MQLLCWLLHWQPVHPDHAPALSQPPHIDKAVGRGRGRRRSVAELPVLSEPVRAEDCGAEDELPFTLAGYYCTYG